MVNSYYETIYPSKINKQNQTAQIQNISPRLKKFHMGISGWAYKWGEAREGVINRAFQAVHEEFRKKKTIAPHSALWKSDHINKQE